MSFPPDPSKKASSVHRSSSATSARSSTTPTGRSSTTASRSAGTTGYGYDSDGDLLATRAPITQVGLTQAFGTGSSLTLTLPGELQTNDQIIVAVTIGSTITVTTPTGYTLVGTYTTGNSKEVILRRTAVSGDSSVTVSLSSSTTASAEAGVYRGVSTSSPIDATSSSGGTGTSVAVTRLTATADSDKLLLAAGATGTFAAGSTFNAPSGMYIDETTTGEPNLSGGLFSQWLTASGATGTRTATFPTSSALEGVLIALNPTSTTTVPTTYTYGQRREPALHQLPRRSLPKHDLQRLR